jgi:serine protease Do
MMPRFALAVVLGFATVVALQTRVCGTEPTLAEEAAFQAAVETVSAGVLRIEPLALTTAEGGAEAAAGRGPATGFVIAKGLVVTTAFAVPDDVDSAVIVLPDGGRRAATVRARDPSRRLVLLAADDLPDPPAAEPLPRDELRAGQWAIAVGRAWDTAAASVAVGIVSATDRVWGKAVQTDAAVSPMNYGGPLIDIAGRVIGILTPLPADTAGMKEGTELYDAGIGFAVPLEDVLAVLPRLERGESLAAGVLGIGYRSRDAINGEPVIASVRQGSPAAKAGLRPRDRIVRLDERTVRRIADARHAIAPRYAGDTITVTVERDAGKEPETIETQVTLVAELPAWRQATVGLIVAPPGAGERADATALPADEAEQSAGDKAPGDTTAREGLPVAWLLPGGPADQAGLRAGDRLTTITAGRGGEPTRLDSREALAGALAGIEPGDSVTLEYTRDGAEATVTLATTARGGDVPDEGPPPPATVADPLAGPVAAVEVVRLEAAEVADPPLAVIPRCAGPIGALVWCGPPRGKAIDAEASAWKAAAARHGIAVILPGSGEADAWSRGDIATVTRAVASLHARKPLDPTRIAIAGRGAGAAFAWLVAEGLGGGVGGVALVDAALPRRATVTPAAPGAAQWILLGPGRDEATRQRVEADRTRLVQAGHAAGLLPAETAADEAAAPPAEPLCRWAALLGIL